ncbi:hypothetical protein, partial [Paenibacillus sp. SAFN-117]|uniref:hypothetical protein n=1 Tax=Paenibacillus sp. SAFN-117 TaxID=3436860 RepID=UPI003F7FF7C5
SDADLEVIREAFSAGAEGRCQAAFFCFKVRTKPCGYMPVRLFYFTLQLIPTAFVHKEGPFFRSV